MTSEGNMMTETLATSGGSLVDDRMEQWRNSNFIESCLYEEKLVYAAAHHCKVDFCVIYQYFSNNLPFISLFFQLNKCNHLRTFII